MLWIYSLNLAHTSVVSSNAEILRNHQFYDGTYFDSFNDPRYEKFQFLGKKQQTANFTPFAICAPRNWKWLP